MRNELWSWSAVDLARAIAECAFSSREAVQYSLDRVAKVNPALNAMVEVLADQALAAADAAVKAGANWPAARRAGDHQGQCRIARLRHHQWRGRVR